MATTPSATTRVFRATSKSPAALKIADDTLALAAGDGNGIVVAKGVGSAFIGPQTWVSSGSERRVAGLWVHQMEFIDMIPETIVTPFPNILIMPPVGGLTKLAEDMAFFAAMLS